MSTEQKQLTLVLPIIQVGRGFCESTFICPYCGFKGSCEDFDCAGLDGNLYCNWCCRILAYP